MQDSSERIQRRYHAKANQCVSLVLSSQQIYSFCSRITIREKNMDRDNVLAAAEEDRLFLFKNEILKDLS